MVQYFLLHLNYIHGQLGNVLLISISTAVHKFKVVEALLEKILKFQHSSADCFPFILLPLHVPCLISVSQSNQSKSRKQYYLPQLTGHSQLYPFFSPHNLTMQRIQGVHRFSHPTRDNISFIISNDNSQLPLEFSVEESSITVYLQSYTFSSLQFPLFCLQVFFSVLEKSALHLLVLSFMQSCRQGISVPHPFPSCTDSYR